MLTKFRYILAPMIAAALTGSACAMNSSSPKQVDCRVVGGDKLPSELGGPDAVCAAIARAAAANGNGGRFSVEVRILTGSSLAATVKTADGVTLPEQRFAISDRTLTKGSIDRFAKFLVSAATQASSR